MSKLAWMTLQAAIVAWVAWVDWDSAREAGTQPHPGVAFGIGLFFAFIVTAGLVVARDMVRGAWTYMQSPSIGRVHGDSGQLTVAGLPGEIDQSSKQRGRLNTADGDAGKAPKLLR
jgi:hypothetical protein